MGGGIADAMELESMDQSTFYLRNSLDIVFFIVVNVIMLNIIFGLIIDAFAALRDSDTERSKNYI